MEHELPPPDAGFEDPTASAPQSVGAPRVAWAVILLLAALIFGLQRVRPRDDNTPAQLDDTLLRVQCQYFVGAVQTLGAPAKKSLTDQLDQLPADKTWQRIRVAIVAGEIAGPERALELLRDDSPAPDDNAAKVTTPEQATPEQATPTRKDDLPAAQPGGASDKSARDQLALLVKIYEDYRQKRWAAPSLDAQQREQLSEQLGWFGQLALHPAEAPASARPVILASAQRTFVALLAGTLIAGGLGLLGFVLLVIFVVRVALGGVPPLAESQQWGGVYVETFAWWLGIFFLLNLVTSLSLGPERVALAGLISFAGSLTAITWARFRGVSWEQLRADLGWNFGRGLLVELPAGIGAYAMTLPLIILAAIGTAVVMRLLGDGPAVNPAAHPIADWIREAGWWGRLQLIGLACIAAPLVEETVFRGLLYRHLREATSRLSQGFGVLLSAGISGVLFALLHPQGFPAIPGIIGIAVGLALMREWRQSLIPCVIAHAINNGVAMTVMMTLLAE